MRRLVLLVLAVGVLAVSGAAVAEPQGCSVLATGHPDMPGSCSYVATGPGEYRVATVSGFRIEVIAPPERKRSLVARSAVPGVPQSGIVAASGPLATLPGDVVNVSITIGSMFVPNYGTWRYQDGYVAARDVG